jgi:hypothetical protein
MGKFKLTGKKQADIDAEVAKVEQHRINQEARKYLKDTDWYVIRKQETGKEIPSDILTAREEARKRIKDV